MAKEKISKPLTEADKTLIRDAFSHYGAEVKKLGKKSEALGLTDEAEGFKDTLREIGVLFGKITGESTELDNSDDEGDK